MRTKRTPHYGRLAIPCEWCGDHFLVWLSEADRKYCRQACYDAARASTAKRPIRQACPVCGALFFASWWEVARGKGRYCSKGCSGRVNGASQLPTPRRDGDKMQARGRISYLVRTGRLPRARTLACVDCGTPATEYDHWKGYGTAHQDDVQPVCRRCHVLREIARGARPRYYLTPRNTPRTLACRICGRPKPPYRHGRCNACRLYLGYHGHDRPSPPPEESPRTDA